MKLFGSSNDLNSNCVGSGKEIRITVSTHNGAVRDINEDSFFINGRSKPADKKIMNICGTTDSASLLLGVCDGMGGEVMGEVASDIAARHSAELYGKLCRSEIQDLLNDVNHYTNTVNSEICKALKNNEHQRGGTTFALAYIRNDTVYAFSLGDSRIYLYQNAELYQISEDHTLAMKKYRSNIYTLEEAETSEDSHKLTLFLGVDIDGNGLTAEWYQPFVLHQGAKLLLCSDGLYDMCSREEIKSILSLRGCEHSRVLTDRALKNGGKDNITCIVAEFL